MAACLAGSTTLSSSSRSHRRRRSVVSTVLGALALAIGLLSPAAMSPAAAGGSYTGHASRSFAVAVTGPVIVGTPTEVAVTYLNPQGKKIPFHDNAVTVTLGTADPGATVQGQTFRNKTSVTVPVRSSNQSAFSLRMSFSVAAPAQTITVQAGTVKGTSKSFAVNGVPTSVAITSIIDTSHNPPLPSPAANQAFAVSFTVLDGSGTPVSAPVTATLTALNAAPGAVLTVNPVTTSNGTGTFSATYSVAQQGLQLQVSSPGLVSGSRTIDVLSAGASANGTPGTPVTLSADAATASLPKGSVGPVSLTTAPVACSSGSTWCTPLITLAGTFTTANGTELYTDDAPATVTWTCQDTCPHPDAAEESSHDDYTVNWRERAEDFNVYTMHVSLLVGGRYQTEAVAPSCVDLTNRSYDGKTGKIVSVAARAAGFCVDVYAISRVDNSFTGDLTVPVLFVEDPRLRGY